MAIALVQIANGGVAHETYGSLTTAVSFASNTTTGNAIIFIKQSFDISQGAGTFAVTDGVNSYTNDVTNAHVGGYLWLTIGSAANITGAVTPTITATQGAGPTAGTFAQSFIAMEVSGLATVGPFDQSSTAYNTASNSPATGATAGLVSANEFIVCAMNANGALTGLTHPPTTGVGTFTTLGSDTTGGGGSFFDFDYQIRTLSTLPTSAAWGTMSTTPFWCAAIATYHAASAGGNSLLNQMANSGGF